MDVIIATPTQKQIYKDCKAIQLKSEEGKLEILPSHENFIALVGGNVTLKLVNKLLKFTISHSSLFQFANDKSVANIVTSSCSLNE